MNRHLSIGIALLLASAFSSLAVDRIAAPLNGDWRFLKSDPGLAASASAFDDSAWETVQLPHAWNAIDGQDGGGDYYRGPAWYRLPFDVESGWSGRRLVLKFHSAQIVADVYVNGTWIGQHRGGYVAFTFDITQAVNFGATNVLAVRVDNSYVTDVGPESGDFTIGGGLTREVDLLVLDPVHISPLDYGSPGVYLTPRNVTAASADLDVKVIGRNTDAVVRQVTLETAILDAEGGTVQTLSSNHALPADASTTLTQQTVVPNPHLWNGLADPYLYRARIRLLDGGNLLDEVVQPLGFRSFSIDANAGFFLNGSYLDLHGTNLHEERKDKGNALSRADQEEDIAISLDLGCTIVRLAHYQHSDFKYSLCDQEGLVVWAEVAQVNRIYDTAAYTANARQQLIELIRQNYNHPSICFWSVSNEITNTTGPNPTTLMRNLAALVDTEDPTRLSTCAQVSTSSTRGRTYNLDCYAMNTYHGWYGGQATDFEGALRSYHATYPADRIGISEYGAGASIHQHEYNPAIPAPGGPWHPEEYQNLFHEAHWLAMRNMPFLWCKLIWNGFDFASDGRNEGDAPGINDKGIVTHDRTIFKDTYYWYRSHWNPEPMVYLTSRRFDPAPNGTIPVKVYSNATAVRLKVNGALVSEVSSTENRFVWPTVALQDGENVLTAEATFPSGTVTDSITFTWTSPPPSLPYLRVNFGTAATTAVPGFLSDTGLPFAARGNGQSYGWNRNLTGSHRLRAVDSRPEYDSLAQLQQGGSNDSWSIALPNGTYSVIAVAGDPSFFDSTYHLLGEGQDLVQGPPGDLARWVDGRAVVEVTDGRLDITNGAQGVNNKLCFLEIRRVIGNAGLLAYEGFAGVGSTSRTSINGYTPDPTTVGISGTWALAGGNNEDLISRATPDFRGIANGHSPSYSGSRQHWWEQRDAWGVNRASVAMRAPIDLSADGVWYMSFFAESGNNNYLAQLGLRNASQELMWGNGYGPGTNGGLTAYRGALGTSVQTNGNNTTVTHTLYKTLFYVARLTKSASGSTDTLRVDIKTYNLDDLNGVIDRAAPATWNRTVTLTGVTGSFTHLQAKIDGGGGNYPGMDEFRLGQTWSAVTDLPPSIAPVGSLASGGSAYGTASTAQSFTVSGTGLTGNLTVTAPAGFETSLTAGSGYAATTIIPVDGTGTLANTTIYIRLAAGNLPGNYGGELTISGGDAVSQAIVVPASTVSPKQLTVSGAAVGPKTYDGTTAATITGTLNGVIDGDLVQFTGQGTFATPNAGTGISVTGGILLTGDDAHKYTIAQPTGLTGDILKADQSITFDALPSRSEAEVFTVAATSSAGLPVSFASADGNASVAGATVTIRGPAGAVGTIRASQSGDGNYHPAPAVERSFSIVARDPATEIRVLTMALLPGTVSGQQARIDFLSDGRVDIYASEDLSTWGAPIATGVSYSPYLDDNLPSVPKFYVLVPAGQSYP